MSKSANIILEDSKGKTVASFIMKRLNVKAAIRRQGMFELISEPEGSVRNQLFQMVSIVCSLCDSKGGLVYPEDKYPKLTAVDAIFDMDHEVYNAIVQAHTEINPATSLAAKKKKS